MDTIDPGRPREAADPERCRSRGLRRHVGRLKRCLVGLTALALWALPSFAAAEIAITDETETTVTFAEPVDRIVAFNAYNAEFVRAVAGIDTLSGMDANSIAYGEGGYWGDGGAIQPSGQNQREPDYEAIVALAPDVVIFPRNGAWEEARQTLSAFDIPVLVLTGWDPLRHTANVAAIGEITGHPDRAKALNDWYTGLQDLLAERLEGLERRTIYVEHGTAEFRAPIPGSGWHDMIVLGGGESVLGDIDIAGQPASRGSVHAFEIEPEFVLKADPEVIVKFNQRSYLPASEAERAAFLGALKARPGWSDLQAMETGELYLFNWFAAGASSKIVGSLQIAKWLYPDRFTDVDPAESMRTWLEGFQGVPYPGTYTYPPADGQS